MWCCFMKNTLLETFYTTIVKYLNSEFVQPITGQIKQEIEAIEKNLP